MASLSSKEFQTLLHIYNQKKFQTLMHIYDQQNFLNSPPIQREEAEKSADAAAMADSNAKFPQLLPMLAAIEKIKPLDDPKGEIPLILRTDKKFKNRQVALYPYCGSNVEVPFLLMDDLRRLICVDFNRLVSDKVTSTEYLDAVEPLIEFSQRNFKWLLKFDQTKMYHENACRLFPRLNPPGSDMNYPLLPEVLIRLRLALGARGFVYERSQNNLLESISFTVDKQKHKIDFIQHHVNKPLDADHPVHRYLHEKSQKVDAVIIKGAQGDPNYPAFQNLFLTNVHPGSLIIAEADGRYISSSVQPHRIYNADQIPTPLKVEFGYGKVLFLSEASTLEIDRK